MADAPLLTRRRLLHLASGGGAWLGLAALGGCRGAGPGDPQLLLVRDQLPAPWLKQLPGPWRPRLFDDPEALLQAVRPAATGPRLLALGDGWAQRLPIARLQPWPVPSPLGQLDPLADPASRLFAPPGGPALAFPWAFGTWLLLLRNRPDLLRRRQEGWNLLLDPSLRRRLVLPSSPRLVIELAMRQLGLAPAAEPAALLEDPRLPAQLRRLMGQALALDERDGVNLLLAGDADAAVVPSQQAIPLLLRDPRLEALLPDSGSPLSWQLLLRLPPAPSAEPEPPLPLDWLGSALKPPLLDRLLAAGWVPPLPRERLQPLLARWPQRLRALLLPPPAVLERCSNLPPLRPEQRQRWQELWDQAGAVSPP